MKPAGLAEKLNSPNARNRRLETTLSDLHHRATCYAEARGAMQGSQQIATHEHQGWTIEIRVDARQTIKAGYPKITCTRPGHSIEVSFPHGHQLDCDLVRASRSVRFRNGMVEADTGSIDSQPAEDLLQAVMDMIPSKY